MGNLIRKVALSAVFANLAFFSSLNAETFECADGRVLEGTIDHLNEKEVTIQTIGGDFITAGITELASTSLAKIEAWASENPELNEVYSNWDVKPSVVRSRVAETPPQLIEPGFKGIVSLRVFLDERGKVSNASVHKSTHGDLEAPAIDAIRKWTFKPAQVAGKPVKARISISFKFEA